MTKLTLFQIQSRMVLTLRGLCKVFIFKFGIEPRSQIPIGLLSEINDMDMATRLDISGRNYTDYHIPQQHACEISLEWFSGEWTITMHHHQGSNQVQQLRAGRRNYMGHEWKKVFLFTFQQTFLGLQDIVVYDFDILITERTVCFYGRFYNQYSGNLVTFRTSIRFSITGHFIKIKTEFLMGATFTTVGERFLRQPDTVDLDFFR